MVLMNGVINGSAVNNIRYGLSRNSPGISQISVSSPITVTGPPNSNSTSGGGGNVTMTSTAKQPLMDISRTSSAGIPISPNTRKSTIMNSTGVKSSPTYVKGSPHQMDCSMGIGHQSGHQLVSSASHHHPHHHKIPVMDLIVDTSYGIHEMLASLALMCLLSILMAFLALFFLQRTGPIHPNIPEEKTNDNNHPHLNSNNLNSINKNVGLSSSSQSSSSSSSSSSPSSSSSVSLKNRIINNAKEYLRVFQISVSLSTLTISLNLCCLFVCCIQFLSAIKLLKTPQGKRRTHQFLKKTSHIRVTAIGAFLISIPIFFTGVILFTFINFDEVPALTTSVIIGIGIIFCGVASVQNVYLWQSEKTKATQELSESRISQFRESDILPTIELSTLV